MLLGYNEIMDEKSLKKLFWQFSSLMKWLDQKAWLILLLMITAYILVFSAFCLIKYQQLEYNALDLAIFNQVFYNTSQGKLFGFTIHPHSYLGDHLELIILLLIPFYLLCQSPAGLLVLQTVFIGLSAIPIFLLTKKILLPRFALLTGFLFLANPFVQNINLFEFHILPFALFFIFFAFYFFQTKKFLPFLFFMVLSLLVREDVALLMIMFAALSWFSKRSLKWILAPFILSSAWFITALKLFPYFNQYQSYKFLYYYSWLGSSIPQIISFALTHPLELLNHIFTIFHFFLVLALLSAFIFIPLVKPRYLLFGILPLLQILLASFSGGELVLQTHYSTLLLASLFMALVYSLGFLFQKKEVKSYHWQQRIKKIALRNRPFVVLSLVLVAMYGTITFGPLPGLVSLLSSKNSSEKQISTKEYYLSQVSPLEKTVTTYQFLAPLSSREKIYSLHYAFCGKKQYSSDEYILPRIDSALIDFNDFLIYQVQFPVSEMYEDARRRGDNRIVELIKERGLAAVQVTDTLAYFTKDGQPKIDLYSISDRQPKVANQKNTAAAPEIIFTDWESNDFLASQHPYSEKDYRILPLSLTFYTKQKIDQDYQLSLSGAEYQKIYPLAYGLYPTSEWEEGKWITINYWLLVPKNVFDQDEITLKLVKLSDTKTPYLGLNRLRSAEFKNVIWEKAGEAMTIPLHSITW